MAEYTMADDMDIRYHEEAYDQGEEAYDYGREASEQRLRNQPDTKYLDEVLDQFNYYHNEFSDFMQEFWDTNATDAQKDKFADHVIPLLIGAAVSEDFIENRVRDFKALLTASSVLLRIYNEAQSTIIDYRTVRDDEDPVTYAARVQNLRQNYEGVINLLSAGKQYHEGELSDLEDKQKQAAEMALLKDLHQTDIPRGQRGPIIEAWASRYETPLRQAYALFRKKGQMTGGSRDAIDDTLKYLERGVRKMVKGMGVQQ